MYIVGAENSNRVERSSVSEEGEVSHVPPGPKLPCKELWVASVVQQDSMLIVTGRMCEGVTLVCVDPGYEGQWCLMAGSTQDEHCPMQPCVIYT